MPNIKSYYYDKEIGYSEVGLGTPYGMCYGASVFNEDDDPELKSEAVSGSISTFRARREMYKRKAHDLRLKYLGALAVANQCEGRLPSDAEGVVYNFGKQYRQAKETYENMKRTDRDYCLRLVEQKQSWLDREKDRKDSVQETEEDRKSANELLRALSDFYDRTLDE